MAVPRSVWDPQMITLSVEDDAGGSCESQVSFVMNTPPTQPMVSLTPTVRYHDGHLRTGWRSTDADGDTVSYV